MKKRLHKGRVVLICDGCAYGRRSYIKFEESEKNIYVCDTQGMIYSITKDDGVIHLMKPELKADHPNPTIHIAGKMHRIMDLIAKIAFVGIDFDNSQIGHLDDNPMNNSFWNLFIDLTPKKISEKVERQKIRRAEEK